MTKEYTIRELSDSSGISYNSLYNRTNSLNIKPIGDRTIGKSEIYCLSEEQVKILTLSTLEYTRYMAKRAAEEENKKYDNLSDLTKKTPSKLLDMQNKWLVTLGLAPPPEVKTGKVSYHNKGFMSK